jgi:hypothetical protein
MYFFSMLFDWINSVNHLSNICVHYNLTPQQTDSSSFDSLLYITTVAVHRKDSAFQYMQRVRSYVYSLHL